MTPVQIRSVVASDLPNLIGLDHSATSDHVWQLELHREKGQISTIFREIKLPRPIQLKYPTDPLSLADEWTSKAIVLIALVESDSVGYIALTERPASAAWVTDLVVAPPWRRRGIAGALLGSAQEWCTGHGHRRLFIEMQSKNQPAIGFAQKHGYDFCGYNDHYYRTQDIALFFARAL